MQVTIEPGIVSGTIKAPQSKSMMQRVCAAALLHKGKTIIHNPGHSDDDTTALRIIQQLGATIVSQTDDRIEIESKGIVPSNNSIDCGESGLSARLFIPVACMHPGQVEINGKGSLLKRTMETFGTLLPALGVQLADFNGYIPFKVKGPIQVKDITISGAISSQFLSGLLFVFAYNAKEPVTIHVPDLKSKPYIDLTIDVLRQFGKPIQHDNYERFYINPALFKEPGTVEVTIEGDWSNASYWLVAALTTGNVLIEGMNINSLQADKKLLDLLKTSEAQIQETENSLQVSKSIIQGFEFDATDCPDLFPALSILAAKCNGESYITGIHRLWHKESNRIESITEMLHQFDILYSIEDDALCIRGRSKFDYATIDSYNDHRIVMAAAIGALHAKGPVTIMNAEAVNKSYPDFFKTLISLGIQCTITETI